MREHAIEMDDDWGYLYFRNPAHHKSFYPVFEDLATSFAEDGVLKLWDMVTGEELMTKAITQTTKDSAVRTIRRASTSAETNYLVVLTCCSPKFVNTR